MKVFSHSGGLSEVVYSLPAIQAMSGGELNLYPSVRTSHRMTRERVAVLRPLLELQPYLAKVDWHEQPVGTDLDGWRSQPRENLNLADRVSSWLGLPHSHREQPWLRVDEVKRVARVVFHRSREQHNWNAPWKHLYQAYGAEAVFVGHPDEHHAFCRYVGPISYHHTRDFRELARVIAGCELFCGNQSAPRAVAEGLKVPVLVEVDLTANNTHFERKGALYCYGDDFRVPPLDELGKRWERSLIERARDRTLISEDRLANIARLARVVEGLSGHAAEVGVFRGGSAKVIGSMLPHKELHLFDTFDGLPADDIPGGPHKQGEFRASESEVRNFLSLCNCRFHVGTFPQSAVGLEDARFSFVHLDADLYETTRAGIEFFLPRLVCGGVMVFDDYGWKNCPGVRRAIEEAEITVHSIRNQAWFQKGEDRCFGPGAGTPRTTWGSAGRADSDDLAHGFSCPTENGEVASHSEKEGAIEGRQDRTVL
jgi:hypothetical protein